MSNEYSLEVKLNCFKEISERKLSEILDKIPGKKDFIIEPPLIQKLQHFIGVTKLREHGIDKIYKLEKVDIPLTNTQRVFIISNDLKIVKQVCDKINAEISKATSEGNSYHMIIIPRKLGSIISLLEEEGIYGLVTVYSFHWELIQLDTKLLSLESDYVFKQLFIDDDQSNLTFIAKTIWSFYLLMGKPANVLTIGKYSNIVANMVDQFLFELSDSEKLNSEIGTVIIVDRDEDYASTLLTGSSYTSLLDEIFVIENGSIQPLDEKSQPYKLTSSDKVYDQIRSKHFSDVFLHLKTQAKDLQKNFSKIKNISIQEMKNYVKHELGSMDYFKRCLSYHISACETIISRMGEIFEKLQEIESCMIKGQSKRECLNYIDELLCLANDKLYALRLMSLYSLTFSSYTTEEITNFKTQFLHRYGYNHLPVFYNLEKLGLFQDNSKDSSIVNKMVQVVSSKTSSFQLKIKKLKLIPDNADEIDLKTPKDISYVFGGLYTPLFCRILEMLIQKECTINDLTKLIPESKLRNDSNINSNKCGSKNYLIYFIGGVTYAEMSACHLLEALTGSQIILAATSIINGNKIMSYALQND